MTVLLKKAYIADSISSFHTKTKDILIKDGIIVKIEDTINDTADKIIESKNLTVSQGWIDIFSNFCDPGFEFKETIETGANAAASGGFTTVFVVPNTQPTISTKSQVEYILQKSKNVPIQILPLGAISKNLEGKELAEMYDMQNSGAIAFSDGLNPLQSPSLLLKALQYVITFNGVIIQMPIDNSSMFGGLMNEGIVSTQLGMPGMPMVLEEIIVKRDIDLVKYSNSKLHFTGITSPQSVDLIVEAKKEGFNITCSVTPYHLFYCDEDLQTYNTNLKTNPPLRSKEDMLKLREHVLTGNIDCIATHHQPQDSDHKICEFEYAKNGMAILESAYSVVQTALPKITVEQIEKLLTKNQKDIFNLSQNTIEINSKANLTLFDNTLNKNISSTNSKATSKNNPFLNSELKGKVIGIVNGEKLYLNN